MIDLTHLTEDQRYRVDRMRRAGLNEAAIAAQLRAVPTRMPHRGDADGQALEVIRDYEAGMPVKQIANHCSISEAAVSKTVRRYAPHLMRKPRKCGVAA